MVIADSYHALCFSVIFHKQFISVSNSTTGSRIVDFFEDLGLSDFLFDNELGMKKYDEVINWEAVDEKVRKLCSYSKSVLDSIKSE